MRNAAVKRRGQPTSRCESDSKESDSESDSLDPIRRANLISPNLIPKNLIPLKVIWLGFVNGLIKPDETSAHVL